MRERTVAILVLLTFLGMVGIYVGLYMAWQKYQAYQAQLNASPAGSLLNLLAKQ